MPFSSLFSSAGFLGSRSLAHYVAPVVCLALLAACSGKKDAAQAGGAPQALPVTVVEVQPQSLPTAIEVMAQTEGAKQTEVRPRVGGILLKRLYTEGAIVKAGQPLFKIDPASYQAVVDAAKSLADQTAREEARLKGLWSQKAISQKEYDDAVSNNEQAQAALRKAQLDLGWTTVTAPVGGISGRAAKSEGSLLTTSDTEALTSIVQSENIWARFGLSDTDVASLPGGQLKPEMVKAVELILPDGSVFPEKGKINFSASTLDTTLGTQQWRAEFSNKAGRLLPGEFVRVRVLAGERSNVFLVPQAAVIQSEQGRLVMVADADNKVSPRPVQTAEWQGKDWVVTGGLKAGDRVIVDNLMKLRPGAPVQPHGPEAAAGGAAPEKAAEAKGAEAKGEKPSDAKPSEAKPAQQAKP